MFAKTYHLKRVFHIQSVEQPHSCSAVIIIFPRTEVGTLKQAARPAQGHTDPMSKVVSELLRSLQKLKLWQTGISYQMIPRSSIFLLNEKKTKL